MKFSLLTLILLFVSPVIFSQENQLDANGLKTGTWKKYYENGNLMYEGSFLEGKPVGHMTRYYDGGVKKAEMYFLPGNISYAQLYYQNGDLAAEGKYIGQEKDSTWNYYSFINGRLTITESYILGKKNGTTTKYFDNGNAAEIMNWKDDMKNGSWEQFFENNQLRLRCNHVNGKRHGLFESFGSDGSYSITGTYDMGKMTGTWIYYKENNEVDLRLEYVDGKMLPNEEYEKREKEFSRLLDESTKSLSDPGEMDFQ